MPKKLFISHLKHTTWEKLLKTIYKKIIPGNKKLANDEKFIEIAKCISTLKDFDPKHLGVKLNKAEFLF